MLVAHELASELEKDRNHISIVRAPRLSCVRWLARSSILVDQAEELGSIEYYSRSVSNTISDCDLKIQANTYSIKGICSSPVSSFNHSRTNVRDMGLEAHSFRI